MVEAIEVVGNPSSVHAEGRKAREIVEAARAEVALLVGAGPSEVMFTSGGTEANNVALGADWDHVLVSGIEHESVLAPARASGARMVEIPAGRAGVVSLDALERLLSAIAPGQSALVSLQLANNETGVLQPVAEAVDLARSRQSGVHCDAVQAVGRTAIDFAGLGLDLMTVSAHKIGGPKGIGALIVRDGLEVRSLLTGGGQESRRRAGTENVIGIAGFGAAARAARSDLPRMPGLAARRREIEDIVLTHVPGAVIAGSAAQRLPNTVCFTWPGKSAETLLIRLDLEGVAMSSGAACSSGKIGPSHVLTAMGFTEAEARSALRISFGLATGEEEIARLARAIAIIAGPSVGQPMTISNTPGAVRSRLETIMGEG